jgi:hypothetical protein
MTKRKPRLPTEHTEMNHEIHEPHEKIRFEPLRGACLSSGLTGAGLSHPALGFRVFRVFRGSKIPFVYSVCSAVVSQSRIFDEKIAP